MPHHYKPMLEKLSWCHPHHCLAESFVVDMILAHLVVKLFCLSDCLDTIRTSTRYPNVVLSSHISLFVREQLSSSSNRYQSNETDPGSHFHPNIQFYNAECDSPDRNLYTGVFDRAVTYIWYKSRLNQIDHSDVIAMTKIWSKMVHIYDQSYDIALMMRNFKLVHKSQRCTEMHCGHRYWKCITWQVLICLVYDSSVITEQDMGWQCKSPRLSWD